MKKLIAISLLCIYLASVCGVSISRFYCCGVLKSSDVSAAIFTKQIPKDDACCKHTQTVIKVNDSHEQVSITWHINAMFALHNTTLPGAFATCVLPFATLNYNHTHGPPLSLRQNPLYIQYCSYLI